MELVSDRLDDLGHPVPLGRPPARIVSLVPSLTEAVAATCPERLVGATDWCTHPPDLDVVRVRGTKNPDHTAVRALEPDLVIANQEENRAADVRRLRAAGIPVWVTVVESVGGAVASLRRLVTEALGVDVPSWLEDAARVWSGGATGPAAPHRTVVVPVWRDPWMVVGSPTYAGDVLRHLGLENLCGGDADVDGATDADAPGRYPRVELADVRAARPDLVLLPDEPYAFGPEDGPEAFPGIPCALVSGRALTWYGPAMVGARAELRSAIDRALAV